MNRVLTMLLVATLFSLHAVAAKATFNKIWLEYDVMHDGKKCLVVRSDVNVCGAKGRDITFVAYFESPKGVGIKDANGKYRTKDGNVCCTKTDDATFENTHWETLGLYIPNEEIHAKSGSHTYYVQILAWLGNEVLGRSEYVSFTMKGATSGSMNNANRGSTKNSSNGTIRTADNSMRVNCVICNGKGVCGNCGGLGYTVPQYGYSKGMQVVCTPCSGTGKCGMCHGKGYSVIQSYGGNVYIDGQYHGGEHGGTDRNRNSSHSSGRCSRCNGTGVNSSPMYVNDPSGAGINAVGHVGYTHSTGNKCPYCGKYSWHIHLKCTKCGYRN